ncbi:hypothetical protein L484_021998 [Morus notabilis]|uniref:C2 domain-containing protein n=1 Tax=Morus notabilis TaxID=981085 RepID=W9RXA5_9ROSA|nr:hypothetical protein L484_021998 [Morus notabilis]
MRKIKAVEDEWTPMWNEEFELPLTILKLALLRVEALNYDTSKNPNFGGQTCLLISELKIGIRYVPLNDRKRDKYKNRKLAFSDIDRRESFDDISEEKEENYKEVYEENDLRETEWICLKRGK